MAEQTASGARTITVLFAALALATLLSLSLFATMMPPGSDRQRVYVALAGNLMLPLVAIPFFVALQARRLGHPWKALAALSILWPVSLPWAFFVHRQLGSHGQKP